MDGRSGTTAQLHHRTTTGHHRTTESELHSGRHSCVAPSVDPHPHSRFSSPCPRDNYMLPETHAQLPGFCCCISFLRFYLSKLLATLRWLTDWLNDRLTDCSGVQLLSPDPHWLTVAKAGPPNSGHSPVGYPTSEHHSCPGPALLQNVYVRAFCSRMLSGRWSRTIMMIAV